LGDGKKVKFWEDIWVGDQSLKDKYSRLFSISKCKKSTMAEVGVGEQKNPIYISRWNLGWN